jgi:ketosteroid isomerase-like protein
MTSNRLRVVAVSTVAALTLPVFCIPTQARDSGSETQKIEALIHSYEKSVSDADTTLAGEVWARSAESSFIHPQGEEHGWEQIKQNVYEKLMRDVFSERKLTASNISVHVYKDAAWAEFRWVFVAKLRSNGSPVRTEGRETQIYHRDGQGWRLVHVHYSGLPASGTQQNGNL